ncbi:adenylate isopentenyltransferase 5, chloroplastic [Zea mays]|jgi:adenylate dimethylallyltransferase (cytokinin synthase)|uniref:adenylate dimethylallyltransferase (ADP/ATP-dependent) n=2 Tax=Zea mays TaxID=4577 RepID=A0A804M660_MAIZE|nr:adenylate isopentenyltransferase 5, chloroplastic [Zea mays]|eukprot:XP_008665655.1 adenylate isopentenyltransferase 5, chloroplastic [Zea mays]
MTLSMTAPAMAAAPPACSPMAARLTMPPLPDAAAPLSVVGCRRVAAKHKAVVVLGATGTGKSRLAIDLALRFGGEVINSDKIQAYAGLDVATNKVGPAERAAVPHHLLGVVHPDAEFTAADFRREAAGAAARVASRGRVPIIAGGSNSYVEELVEGDRRAFRERYDCCFLWVDARLPVLHGFVARRVDEMCRRGLVDEVAAAFDPRRTDYSRGIWRAIGVPEMDAYLRAGGHGDGDGDEQEQRARMLAAALDEIKVNTSRLALRQRGKIQRLARMWRVRRVDATEVFLKRGHAADEAWQRLVAAPCIDAVRSFLLEEQEYSSSMVTASMFASTAAAAV